MSTQWYCEVQCYLKFKHDTKNSAIFNLLPYLTSPTLTECENTTVTDNRSNKYSKICYSPLIPHLGTRHWWWAVSRSGSFICGTCWKGDYV